MRKIDKRVENYKNHQLEVMDEVLLTALGRNEDTVEDFAADAFDFRM